MTAISVERSGVRPGSGLFVGVASKSPDPWISRTLVFAGGIGENAPLVRARICEGLSFLGIELNESRNAKSTGVISTDASQATVRVIRTDEEQMIAQSSCRVLGFGDAHL